MDLEHLTKHQILLLTLLVSFVTSIATGIVTVSLMDQAPAGVTRVINQIVERTVETVAPQTQGAAASSATTVVVKDDDLTAQSIAKVQKAVARITARGEDTLLARSVIINANGVALTDRAALAAMNSNVFDAILASGERVPAVLRSLPAEGAIAVIDIVVGTSSGFAPAVIADASSVKLGQSVIRIGGGSTDTVAVGVIASLSSSAPSSGESTIEASVGSDVPGSVLTTLFGEVIGLTTAQSKVVGSAHFTTPAAAAL